MKRIILIFIIILCAGLSGCVIETPEQHYGKPKAGEPTGLFASMSVTCETVLDKLDGKETLAQFVPEDGVILEMQSIEIMRGDTALKFLTDALTKEGILYVTDKAYVRGINHLHEKEFGSESGWIYFINGKSAPTGAGSYVVKENDVIEWRYTCTLGDLA